MCLFFLLLSFMHCHSLTFLQLFMSTLSPSSYVCSICSSFFSVFILNSVSHFKQDTFLAFSRVHLGNDDFLGI